MDSQTLGGDGGDSEKDSDRQAKEYEVEINHFWPPKHQYALTGELMPSFYITEHHGRKIKEKMMMSAGSPEEVLRACVGGPCKMPPDVARWRFIDDGMGGGALVDPKDEDHCLLADPRPEFDDQEDANGI
jgi:hypothetical protein